MITFMLMLFLMFSSPLIAGQFDSEPQGLQPGLSQSAFSLSDFGVIACASTQIAQVYTDSGLSDMKDTELAPENQIRLYENFTDQICRALSNKMQNIEFLCYDDIRKRLDDIDLWNDFNLYFTGREHVSPDMCLLFAEKLQVRGVITSSLMFYYYENPDKSRYIEVQFKGSLIDLESGRPAWQSRSKCQKDIIEPTANLEFEYDCFGQVGDEFINEFATSGKGK